MKLFFLLFLFVHLGCIQLSAQSSADILIILNKNLKNDNHLNTPETGQFSRPKMGIVAVFQLPVLAYQVFISSQMKPHCYFHPSCSSFALQSIGQYGILGVFLSADRIMRCHPMAEDKYPLYKDSTLLYDPVSRYGDNNAR